MPGKYANNRARRVHELTLDTSWLDDQCGTVEDIGWHGLMFFTSDDRPAWLPTDVAATIVSEDNAGFVNVDEYPDRDSALADWALIENACDGFYDDDEPTTAGPWCDIHNAPHEPGNLICELRSAEAWANTMEGS